jgi:hypothetical protein
MGWLGFQDSGWAARPSLKPVVEKTMKKINKKTAPTGQTQVW